MARWKKDENDILKKIDPENLPKHIAIIMDGNGRWAKAHRFRRIIGHRQGVKAVKDIVKASSSLGVKVLSLYAFSEENWNRPQIEVKALMALLKEFLAKERKELFENNVQMMTIGNTAKLPKDVREELSKSCELMSKNTGLILNLALSYGGRDEIVRAVNKYMEATRENGNAALPATPERFSLYLDTKDIPDPDLLIRTSGEQRISNFMLWQLAYTEIVVTDILWPDIKKADLYEAIIEYQKRERRFGLLSEQVRKDNSADISF
jgi:undecaprenyl diphosphate synthase